MSSLLHQNTLIDYIDNFSLCRSDGNVASKKETEAAPLGVKVANAWENSGVEVSFCYRRLIRRQ